MLGRRRKVVCEKWFAKSGLRKVVSVPKWRAAGARLVELGLFVFRDAPREHVGALARPRLGAGRSRLDRAPKYLREPALRDATCPISTG